MFSNTRFAMAVHLLTALAYHRGEPISSAVLAGSVGTNPAFLRTVLGRLRDKGLVETRLGKGGGALLAREAKDITLYDVYEAMDDGEVMGTHSCKGGQCIVAQGIPTVLGSISDRIRGVVGDELRKTSIAQVQADIQAAI